jgi:hypothetical protein
MFWSLTMKVINKKFWIYLSVLAITTFGCNLVTGIGQTETQVPNNALFTAAAFTVEAKLTEAGVDWQSPTSTLPPVQPPATPYPTYTPFPTATNTKAPTATSVPCNHVQFIADITVADKANFAPGTQFTKIWRLKNIGSCTWTDDYNLVFFSGDKLEGKTLISLPKEVSPGETVNVAVSLKAPSATGTYVGYWQLRNDKGIPFGLGVEDKPFWVEIKVVDPGGSFSYDFAANICQASWRDLDGKIYCQGTGYLNVNYVQYTVNPRFETDQIDDEGALILNVGEDDRIQGVFPAYTVQTGDHFRAVVGCVYGSKKCDAKFSLAYRLKGDSTVVQLGSWAEDYDRKLTHIDVDLSALDGKEVEFILMVKSKSGSDENMVFWFGPRIVNY